MIKYIQCKFQKDNTFTTAWIEDYGAKVGNRVTFEEEPTEWWNVIEVYDSIKMTKEDVLDRARDHVHFKKTTSIAKN